MPKRNPFAKIETAIRKVALAYPETTEDHPWGENAFKTNDPKAVAFATDLIGAGAGELRDMVVMSWRESATGKVGWPAVAVEDVVAGKTDPWVSLLGKD